MKTQKLNKETIKSILQESDRWGINKQPELDIAVDALFNLEVTMVSVENDDEIDITTTKLLSISHAFTLLERLNPQEVDRILPTPPNTYRIWWD